MLKHKIFLGSEQIRLRDTILAHAKLGVKVSNPLIRTAQTLSAYITRQYDDSIGRWRIL